MTPDNEALLKDARALVRESLHVRRAAGWADLSGQLIKALEHSEQERERLEAELAKLQATRTPRIADAIPGVLTITLPEGP